MSKKKEDKKEDKDPLEGCPVTVPRIDEGELLSDIRSPRFLQACKRLRIDPIDLKPRHFETFKQRENVVEKQQIRYAMYERGRFMKWKAINDCRRTLPSVHDAQRHAQTSIPAATRASGLSLASGGHKHSKSLSASPELSRNDLSQTWLGAVISKTSTIASRGQVEVFKAAAKPLKDIAVEGRFVAKKMADTQAAALESRQLAEQRRKELIKRHAEERKKQKEKAKKALEEMAEKEAKFKELDEAEKARQQALYEQWEAESAEKRRQQDEHFARVQQNVQRQDEEKKEKEQRLLKDLEEKMRRVEEKQHEWIKGGESGINDKAAAAEARRQEVLRNQVEKAKFLLAEHKKTQLVVERKEEALREKQNQLTKHRKEKEIAHRKRIADIQKQKKEKMRKREEEILEHMHKADASLQASREAQERDRMMKAEIERLRRVQAQENVDREKERQEREAAELAAKRRDRVALQNEREEIFKDVLKERAMHATQIRLHKDQIKEEIFNIKVTNSWNRANQLLRELEPRNQ